MSISGGAHLVSSNHFQGLPVKNPITTIFFSRDLLPKSKCPLYFKSLARVPLPLTCKASGSNNDRRNPRPRKKNYQGPPPTPRGKFKNFQDQDDPLETSQILSSQNGRSTNSEAPVATKSANPADIVELFKKHLPQLRESTKNSNRSYGLNATLLNRDKEDRESFKSLLKLLKSSGANQKNVGSKGSNNNLSKSLKYEEPDVEDTENDIIEEDSDIEDDGPEMLDSEPKPITSSRPPSSFSRRSAISVAGIRSEEKNPGSESLFYESESEIEEEPGSHSVVYESENDSVATEKSGSEFMVYESESESVAEQSEGLHPEEKMEDLSSLKLPELKEIAKSRGLKGYSKLKKAELLEQLSLS